MTGQESTVACRGWRDNSACTEPPFGAREGRPLAGAASAPGL